MWFTREEKKELKKLPDHVMLDDFIADLEKIRQQYGNVKVQVECGKSPIGRDYEAPGVFYDEDYKTVIL